jgi:hypothetical protein
MPTRRLTLVVAVVAVVVLGAPGIRARQDTTTLTRVMERIRSLRRTTDFKTEGRLVRLDAAGRRTISQFRMKVKAFPGTISVLYEVTDPPADRLRLLIDAREADGLRMQVARERDRQVQDLGTTHTGDALLDSTLAYEDLADAHLGWRDQQLTGEETCGDRTCYVIRSQPDAEADSHYATVTSWIDKDICFPIIVRKRLRGATVVKEFTYHGLRQSKGQWGARQVDVRLEGSPRRTLLVVTRGSAKAGLTAEDFAPRVLVSDWR